MVEFLSFVPQNEECDFQRIDRLQNRMNNRIPTICPERAEIITESFQETEGEPIVIRRAKALKAILEKMTIYIEPDSLIFGNQARENFAAPVFPEYSFDWVIEEMEDFPKRSGDYFNIDEDTKERLRKLQSYWHGKTHQDEVKRNLTKINKLAAEQAVLHRGGISMSGDGHIIPNHDFVLEVGYGGMARIAEEKLEQENLTREQKDFYQAVVIAMNAALSYIKRFGELADRQAKEERDEKRRKELLVIKEMCTHLMEGKAESFYEAVETVYLTHLLMMIESNGHSFSFGRFDQYIYPIIRRIWKREFSQKKNHWRSLPISL